MKNLITFCAALLLGSVVLRLANIPIANQLTFIQMLALGILVAKFSIDFMKNKASHSQYFKYSIIVGFSFLTYSGALFTIGRIQEKYTVALFFLALLSFVMIGLSETYASFQKADTPQKKRKGFILLVVFGLHVIYALSILAASLKGWNIAFIIPIAIGIDVLVIAPFIFVNKLYKQYLLVATILFTLSVSLLVMPKEYLPNAVRSTELVMK